MPKIPPGGLPPKRYSQKESRRRELEGLRTQLKLLTHRNQVIDKETEERFKRLSRRVKKLEEETKMETEGGDSVVDEES